MSKTTVSLGHKDVRLVVYRYTLGVWSPAILGLGTMLGALPYTDLSVMSKVTTFLAALVVVALLGSRTYHSEMTAVQRDADRVREEHLQFQTEVTRADLTAAGDKLNAAIVDARNTTK